MFNRLIRWCKPKMKDSTVVAKVTVPNPLVDLSEPGLPLTKPISFSRYHITMETSSIYYPFYALKMRKVRFNHALYSEITDDNAMISVALHFLRYVGRFRVDLDGIIARLNLLHNDLCDVIDTPRRENFEKLGNHFPVQTGLIIMRDDRLRIEVIVKEAMAQSAHWYNITKWSKLVLVTLGILLAGALFISGIINNIHKKSFVSIMASFMNLIPLAFFSLVNSICNSYLKSYAKEFEVYCEALACLFFLRLHVEQLPFLSENLATVSRCLNDARQTRSYSDVPVRQIRLYVKAWLDHFVSLNEELDKLEDDFIKKMQ